MIKTCLTHHTGAIHMNVTGLKCNILAANEIMEVSNSNKKKNE